MAWDIALGIRQHRCRTTGHPTEDLLDHARMTADSNVDRPLRVLLADDNFIVHKVTLAILEQQGYQAHAVADGVQALQALEQQPYDVILMDIQMPNKDGLEATRDIRATLPADRQPYIIGITASITTQICDACFEAGMDDYLPKPFRAEDLAAALERVRPGSDDPS